MRRLNALKTHLQLFMTRFQYLHFLLQICFMFCGLRSVRFHFLTNLINCFYRVVHLIYNSIDWHQKFFNFAKLKGVYENYCFLTWPFYFYTKGSILSFFFLVFPPNSNSNKVPRWNCLIFLINQLIPKCVWRQKKNSFYMQSSLL